MSFRGPLPVMPAQPYNGWAAPAGRFQPAVAPFNPVNPAGPLGQSPTLLSPGFNARLAFVPGAKPSQSFGLVYSPALVVSPLAEGRLGASLTTGPDHFFLSHSGAERRPFARLQAQRLADRFCKATLQDWGTDELEIKDTLKTVVNQGLLPEFETAVRQKAAQRGVVVRNAEDVINQKMARNALTRYFQAAPRQECLDYLRVGRNTYSPSAWAYRRYGMYRSVMDFVGVCRKHPVMSASVIGVTAILGDKYPFVGAVSGVGLMAWAGVMSLVNEVKARKHPAMGASKAEHYKQSGENLAAVIMTAPGYHGIADGSVAGLKVLTLKGQLPEGLKKLEKMPTQMPQGFWGAISLDKNSPLFEPLAKGPRAVQLDGKQGLKEQTLSVLKRGLFVFGLFDNVLLPFNCLADQLDDDNGTGPPPEA